MNTVTFFKITNITEEAQQEAKEKMHPQFAESMWTDVTSAATSPYKIKLDAATAIYAATK